MEKNNNIDTSNLNGHKDSKNNSDNQKPKPRHSYKPWRTRDQTVFSVGIEELKPHYFECSATQKTDRFVKTVKEIKEHVCRTYRHGGDIRDILETLTKYVITPPVYPVTGYTDILDPVTGDVTTTACQKVSFMEDEVFKQKISTY